MLSVLTFADLRDEIDRAASKATSTPKKQGWATLRETVSVAEAEPPDAAALDPASDSKQWWLLGIDVKGFRGIPATTLSIDFDPTPGVTVIHGPNGSGKSSICDAIDVALHQDTSASLGRMTGTGGRAPVWEPVLLHSEGTEAEFHIRLLSTENEQLTLDTHLTGIVVSSKSGFIATREGLPRSVVLGEAWRSALSAYSPTYAYATWEQRIQLAQDLQKYLEKMLVLGGCFVRIEQTIADQEAASLAASEEIRASRREAQRLMQTVEREFDRESHVDLSFDVAEDPAEWWIASGLPEPASNPEVELTPIATATLLELSDSAKAALIELPQTDYREAVLAHALHELNEAVAASVDRPATCPVCGALGTWQEHLDTIVRRNESVVRAIRGWGQALSELVQEARRIMPALQAASDPTDNSLILSGSELLEALTQHLMLEAPTSVKAREIATRFLDLVTSERFARQSALAMKRASAESAWLRQQCRAVAGIYGVWVEQREAALDLQRWTEARRCLEDLAKRLKSRRQDALESATNRTVAALLRDVGLEVARMNVQKRQADLVLRDESGRELELGMLSAGQRNAVLLAPALAVAEGGPFRFLVIDDPVHSFDELRVDQIARQLIDLSRNRRVVVLTHDERLREHLLASPTPVDSRSIRRDPKSGVVEVRETGPMWSTLLDDAQLLSQLSRSHDPSRIFLANTIRGLCRQAVDNALRLLVTREAVRQLRDPKAWIAQLDAPGVNTTVQRLDVVEQFEFGTPRQSNVRSARAILQPYLKTWNKAAHGNPPEDAVSEAELEAARAGCRRIVHD